MNRMSSYQRPVVWASCDSSITALHFDRGIAYILCFLTHAEYSKDRWKSVL